MVLNGVAKTYAMTGWRVGLDDRARRRDQGGHQPAVARHVERRQREPARRAGRGVRRPHRGGRDARRLRAARPHDAPAPHRHRGRHRPRAAGRVLRLPQPQPLPRQDDPRPHVGDHARAVQRAARRGQGGHRPGRGLRRARLRRASATRSATTTSARAAAASPTCWPRRSSRMADAAVRVLAHPDHERAGRALGAPAQRRARRRRRRVVVGGPSRGGRPHRRAAPPRRRLRRRGAAGRRTAPAPRCTSTAAARGGCATACCGSPTGRRSACTGSSPAASPAPLTPEPAVPRGLRYADGDLHPDGTTLLCVQEEHHADGREATNTIVRLAAHEPSTPEVVVDGPDFVSDPRWRPDGDGVLLARVGPPRHAVGRHPPRRRRGRARARSWPAATSGSRSASRRGRPTARSGSSATAPGSGACTAGRRTAGARPWSTSARTSATPQWVFGQSQLRVPRRRPGRVRVLATAGSSGSRCASRTSVASRPSTCPHTLDRRAARTRQPRRVHRRQRRRPSRTSSTIDVDAGAVDVLVPPRDLGLDRRLVLGARADLVPDGRGRHRARAAVPADQPGGGRHPTGSARRCS